FKKSGEFERLRRDLLSQFQSSGSLEPLLQRVEDIAQKRLDTDEKLHSKAPEVVQKELLQELDRYPMVERAVGETSLLSDPALASGIQQHARKILKRSRGEAVTGTFRTLSSTLHVPLTYWADRRSAGGRGGSAPRSIDGSTACVGGWCADGCQ
ncbi:hypothetical protein BV25DRAFT_1807627, partial [Artomyces pyxidatus]